LSEIREIMTWDIFGVASRELAIKVAESGYEPDIILAIARGGLLSAGALGYALSVKNTYTMNVEFYTGVNERLAVPMILPPVPSLVDLKDSKVLIVDDVADTGITSLRATEDSDAEQLARTGVIGDAKTRFLLNHLSLFLLSVPTWPSRGSRLGASSLLLKEGGSR